MALPNLIALLLLSPEAMRQWRWWIKKRAYERTFH
jgi:Na+/alanine symporter